MGQNIDHLRALQHAIVALKDLSAQQVLQMPEAGEIVQEAKGPKRWVKRFIRKCTLWMFMPWRRQLDAQLFTFRAVLERLVDVVENCADELTLARMRENALRTEAKQTTAQLEALTARVSKRNERVQRIAESVAETAEALARDENNIRNNNAEIARLKVKAGEWDALEENIRNNNADIDWLKVKANELDALEENIRNNNADINCLRTMVGELEAMGEGVVANRADIDWLKVKAGEWDAIGENIRNNNASIDWLKIKASELDFLGANIRRNNQFLNNIKRMQHIYEQGYRTCHRVVIAGTGADAAQLLTMLKSFGEDGTVIGFASVQGEERNRTWLEDRQIFDLETIIDKIDCVLVNPSANHAAVAAQLRIVLGNISSVKIIDPLYEKKIYPDASLFFNAYCSGGRTKSETAWNAERMADHTTRDIISAYVEAVRHNVPLFSVIEVETQNRCNGTCAFCPVNRKQDPRPFVRMSDALFHKIVGELRELDYNGNVGLYSNNEPLMDTRVVDYCEYLRQELPAANTYLHTNGQLLTMEKLERLAAVTDDLIIDNYNAELEWNPTAILVSDFAKAHPLAAERITVVMRDPNEILTTRGGAAPNRVKKVTYTGTRCLRPFTQVVVRPDGKLSLCCNDALGACTLGDLTKQTLVGAWYGQEYTRVREAICQGREQIDICRYCDEFNTSFL